MSYTVPPYAVLVTRNDLDATMYEGKVAITAFFAVIAPLQGSNLVSEPRDSPGRTEQMQCRHGPPTQKRIDSFPFLPMSPAKTISRRSCGVMWPRDGPLDTTAAGLRRRGPKPCGDLHSPPVNRALTSCVLRRLPTIPAEGNAANVAHGPRGQGPNHSRLSAKCFHCPSRLGQRRLGVC